MPRYGDETSTGRLGHRRGSDRVTIAARAESPDGFSWWPRWLDNFAPEIRLGGEEPKSEPVLCAAGRSSKAKGKLLEGLGPCRVFVMSIRENTNRLLEVFRKINPGAFAGRDPLRVLERISENGAPELRRLAFDLKEMAVRKSTVGSLEAFLNFDPIATAVREAGFPTSSTDHKFDREAFRQMGLKEIEEFSGRFAILVADALSPDAQAKAIEGALTGSRLFMHSMVAVNALKPTMSANYVLDIASSTTIASAVEHAHGEVEMFLRRAQRSHFESNLRIGTVEQDNSRRVLGIQVADVAAAVASNIFEGSGKPTLEAARGLKNHFEGVFLNHDWL